LGSDTETAQENAVAASSSIPSAKTLIAQYNAGKLIDDLSRRHGASDEKDQYEQRCVALHNTGRINLLRLISGAALAQLNSHRFFTLQHFYCNTIPKLNASARDVMSCCRALIDKAGNDGAAGLPNLAFRDWCRANPKKAMSVIGAARTGDELARRFLGFALQARDYVKVALDFAKNYADDRRLSGIFALGQIKHATLASAREAMSVLQIYISSGQDDHLRASALRAAFEVLKQFVEFTPDDAANLVKTAGDDPGPQTLLALSDILWLDHARLSDEAVRTAFDTLLKVDPAHTRTIHNIDMALHQLLGTPHEVRALDFISELLSIPGGTLTVENFQSFGHEIAHGDPLRLYRLLMQAFLAANLRLSSGLADLLMGAEERAPFDTSAAPLNLTSDQQIFVCRKAIGFLFLKPMLACSILLSVLRACDSDVAHAVRELLFDPLLVNYGGEAKDYLKTIAAGDAAHAAVQWALDREKEHSDGLRAAGTTKELHPSEYQRDIQRRRAQDEMREVQKHAQSKSIWMNLVRHSVLLYGRRSLLYVQETGNRRRAVEMDLKPIGVALEMPRLETIDPVGLDYKLRVFRVERLKR
jgi:hypothetical protein